ncbi:MAG: PUA domain-containing protein, partial [Candidatus Thermoplasmatota archaeon]|nr:PUA domain-containing protein [Candidatus Thermoplasmatota archaeon]
FSRLEPEKHYLKAIVHAGSSSKIITELLRERKVDTIDTEAENPSSLKGLEILQEATRTAIAEIPVLSSKNRAKGEAIGLAKFQYGELSSFLVESEISGYMPYKLRCGDLATISPRVGGFGLTLAGAAKYVAKGGPSVTAEDFKLVGDLFAVGVKSYDGNWVIGDQVVIKQKGKVTGVGIAKMGPEEMISMGRGLAVEVRHHA